jgi:cyclophilin family peptidyl-prolyl cis-trans isomerase
MRVFFLLMVIGAIGLGGWYLYSRPVADPSLQAQADNFANSALSALYSASSTAPTSTMPTNSTQTQDTITNASSSQSITTQNNTNENYMRATLHTNQGDITIEFFDKDAPNTVANFRKLAGSGFYDGTKFHRVIAGFMIQGGDPLSKDDSLTAQWGTGGPGYTFADEIRPNNHNIVGTIAMANSGPNTNGSQFFINVADNSYLDGKHTTFGKVIDGMDVVDKIQHTPTDGNDRPITPVVVTSVTLAQ